MNEMKAKALEKLMMILDDVLGEDVAGRMKGKAEGAAHEKAEGPEAEGIEDVLEESMGEESPEEHGMQMRKHGEKEKSESGVVPPTPVTGGAMKGEKPGVGVEVSKVEVAAMPRSGLMKKMGKKLA